MGEEGKVVSFLKGFTDRAFAGHLLRAVQANTLGTATEVALEKEAERKKENQVMDEEPVEMGAAQTNQDTAEAVGFLSILETVQRHMGQLQACRDEQESRTTTGTEMSQHLVANKRTQAVLWTTHTDAQRRVNLNPNHCANKELMGCLKQPISQSAHAAKRKAITQIFLCIKPGIVRLQGATNSSTVTILYIARYC